MILPPPVDCPRQSMQQPDLDRHVLRIGIAEDARTQHLCCMIPPAVSFGATQDAVLSNVERTAGYQEVVG